MIRADGVVGFSTRDAPRTGPRIVAGETGLFPLLISSRQFVRKVAPVC